MKTVGKRRVRTLSINAMGELLREGAMFNDELHRLPTGGTTFFPKGIYRYKTHQEANAHWEECIAMGIGRNDRRGR